MAQLLIRKLDDDVKERLRSRAKARGVSMEEEARSILTAKLTASSGEHKPGLGTRIAAHFRNIPDNDEPLDFDLRDEIEPVKFD